MGRPREFEREKALGEAMQVFWTHGYEVTSMSDLQRAMGIGRQSLYDTFGGKRQVFEESLQGYLENVNAWNHQMLGERGLEGIRAFLNTTVRELARQNPRRACLMFNTCFELAPHDAEIAKQVRKGVKAMQRSFEGAVKRGQEEGTIRAEADARRLGVFFTAQIGGLAVMARGGASKREMQVVADVALQTLE